MTKYQEYFQKMVEANKESFASFQRLHDEYALNPDQNQEKFNHEGEKILNIVREWENKLCLQSEKGGYGKFTSNLSEKFQAEVKKTFPMIDHIGIIVKQFNFKKINLN
jgi:hypothetical protein